MIDKNNITKETALNILIPLIVKGEKAYHKDYKHTVDKADLYFTLITGVGMDKQMRAYVKREDVEAFEQRKTITQHIVTAIVKRMMYIEYKAIRSNSLTRVLGYTDDEQKNKLNELNKILNIFWGDKNFDKYINLRATELENSDPNAFVVYDWDSFDEKEMKAQPYPYEVKSNMAIDYHYVNNILKYLVAKDVCEYEKKDNSITTGDKYTFFFTGGWIKLTQVDKDKYNIATENKLVPGTNLSSGEQIVLIKIKDNVYVYNEGDTNLDFLPIIRVGYERDLETDGRTFVNGWDVCIPLLKKTIKTNSELDITMCNAAHPQRIQHVHKCTNPDCISGRIRNTDELCPTCKGENIKVPTSAQDALLLPIPDNPANIMSLDNIVKYISPDTGIITILDAYIDKISKQCIAVRFNSEMFTKEQIAETATSKVLDLTNVYDVLYPLVQNKERQWMFGIKAVASITDMLTNLIYSYSYGKDFGFETKADLLEELKVARDAGVEAYILQNYMDEIATIDYADDKYKMSQYLTKKRFFPFTGKTWDEISLILSQKMVTDFTKVLWANYEIIFDEIELDMANQVIKENFYEMATNKQWEIIKTKVEALMVQVEEENEQPEPEVDFSPFSQENK